MGPQTCSGQCQQEYIPRHACTKFRGGQRPLTLRPGLTSFQAKRCWSLQKRAMPGVMVRAAAPAAVATVIDQTKVSSSDLTAVYKKLQNGSDVRGIAVAGVPGEEVNITATTAFFIGAAFAELLAKRQGLAPTSLRASVGRDPRISGQLMSAALTAGLASKGVSVGRFGIATTPAVFLSCISEGYEYDGAIMITASHLPYNRQGFKFFTKEGGFEKADITELLKIAAAENEATAQRENISTILPGARYTDDAYVTAAALTVDPSLNQQVDFMPVYSKHLRTIIQRDINHPENYERPLEGFHIVVDPGNGSGGFLTSQVLEPLGANTTGSQFLEPDGWFPNHVPNPEDPAAMRAGAAAVKRAGADLGIVVDTDVDRSAVVTANGEVVNSNRYIALMAYITLSKYPGTTIVTDSVTSNGLTKFIEGLGGRHFRYKRGYKNVISKGVELNGQGVQTELMMETSGHGAMKENYYLDDGTYSASLIVVLMVKRYLEGKGKNVGADLLSQLEEPAESKEFRIKLLDKDNFKELGASVLEKFNAWIVAGKPGPDWSLEKENWEGWRANINEGDGKRGWALLRQSLHDPLLVLNVESDLPGGTCSIVRDVLDFFESEVDDKLLNLDKLYEQASTCTTRFN